MKAKQPEYVEGPEAWKRLEGNMRKLLTVPKAELQRREAEYRKQVDANANRRGPQRGVDVRGRKRKSPAG
jgi:hypothetical protein